MRRKPPRPPKSQPPKTNFWDNGGQPLMIAHRGGDSAGAKKENTVATFKSAIRRGYSYGETDVIVSADGQVIAMHGASNFLDSVFRGRPSRNRLQRKNLRDIRREVKPYSQVPLLSELLEACPDMKFFIDPKTKEVVEPLVELLKKMKALDRVCVGSFDYKRVMRLRKMLGPENINTSLIVGRGLRVVNRKLDMLKAGSVKHVEAIQLHHSLVSRPMLDLIHQQGFRALIWTCNSEIAIKNAINCGADGIISDRISLLKEVVSYK
jgi:glycerophosphoryl diester phosphodiesterase